MAVAVLAANTNLHLATILLELGGNLVIVEALLEVVGCRPHIVGDVDDGIADLLFIAYAELLLLSVVADVMYTDRMATGIEECGDARRSAIDVSTIGRLCQTGALECLCTQHIRSGRHVRERLVEVERHFKELAARIVQRGRSHPAFLLVESGIHDEQRHIERLLDVGRRGISQEVEDSLTSLLNKLRHLCSTGGAGSLTLHLCNNAVKGFVGALGVFRMRHTAQLAKLTQDVGYLLAERADAHIVHLGSLFGGEDEPTLRGSAVADVESLRGHPAIGGCREGSRIAGGMVQQPVAAWIRILRLRVDSIHTGLHHMEVGIAGGSGNGLCGVAVQIQIVARLRIAQLIELVLGCERDVPRCLVLRCKVGQRYLLPRERAVFVLHQIGSVEATILVFVLQVVLHVVFHVNGVIRIGKMVAAGLKAILHQRLADERVAYIEQVGTIVLVCSVDAIGPHVSIVTIQLLSGTIVEEA